MHDIERVIEDAFEAKSDGFEDKDKVREAVKKAISLLDSGKLRVAEKKGTEWHVNQWLKKAVLLSFTLSDNKVIEGRVPTSHPKLLGLLQKEFEK